MSRNELLSKPIFIDGMIKSPIFNRKFAEELLRLDDWCRGNVSDETLALNITTLIKESVQFNEQLLHSSRELLLSDKLVEFNTFNPCALFDYEFKAEGVFLTAENECVLWRMKNELYRSPAYDEFFKNIEFIRRYLIELLYRNRRILEVKSM